MILSFMNGDDQDFVHGMCDIISAYKGGKHFIATLEKDQHIKLKEDEKETIEQMKKVMDRLWYEIVGEMRSPLYGITSKV